MLLVLSQTFRSDLTCARVCLCASVDEDDDYECVTVMNAHTQDVKHIVWHPNQEVGPSPLASPQRVALNRAALVCRCPPTQLLASASYDNNICLYKEEDDDWECCATLKGHASTVWSLCFDAAGERLASCSDDGTVRIWKEYPGQDTRGKAHNNRTTPLTRGRSSCAVDAKIKGPISLGMKSVA